MATVLIVDDAVFMQMTVKKMIEEAGHTVVGTAGDGVIAVEQYKKLAPDLVTLDITMPNLDGIGALKLIMEHNPQAKVIMCSAMGQESMVVEAIKLGAKDFLVKPFKAERVVKTLNTLFPLV